MNVVAQPIKEIMKEPKDKDHDNLWKCGLIGALTIIGCLTDVVFTYIFEWSPWEFGAVFSGIMIPGKGIKIIDSMVMQRKK